MKNIAFLLILVLFAACAPQTASPSMTPPVTNIPPSSQPPASGLSDKTPVVHAGEQIITYVPSEGIGNIAVRITFPDAPRYPDGASVVVDVATFFTPTNDFYEDLDAAPLGLIRVAYLWPGKESRSSGARSDGVFAYGGESDIRALRDVIRFAGGQIPDKDGHTIGDLSPFPVLTDQVGLYAFSHPGIAAVNVLALYGDQLHVRYFVGRENPTVDAISAVELGYWDESQKRRRAVGNPLYRYPESYSPTAIDLDYSSVRWDADWEYPEKPGVTGYPYFDLNGNNRYDEGDFILGYKVPQMFGVRVYSTALTEALRANGLSESQWPADLATPEQAAEWWDFRVTPPRYPVLAQKTPDLKVLLLFCQEGHVVPLTDIPGVHQAYDGFRHTAGLWTRLNPDAAYLPDTFFAAYQEHPANTEPDDWLHAATEWGYPPGKVGTVLGPQAAVAEMADRTHENNWDADLSAALYPLETQR